MKSRKRHNKSHKLLIKRHNRKNKRRSIKYNSKSFLGIRAFACALRKKNIGGGNFIGDVCDFSPLNTANIAELESTVRIPIESDLNLIIPDSGYCIVERGGNNRVCTKICKENGSEKRVIYREGISSIVGYTFPTEDPNIYFEVFNDEMKLQIMFAEKGLAPEVYMYGLINVSEHLSSHAKLSMLPPTLPEIKNFCVIEQKEDFHRFLIFYYNAIDKYTTGKYTKKQIDALTSIFNELFDKIMILYDEIAALGYVFIDLKPSNIVYSKEPDGSYKVFMIDFDTRFCISPFIRTVFDDASWYKKTPNISKMDSKHPYLKDLYSLNSYLFDELLLLKSDEEKTQMRASVMKYLFCAYMLVNGFIPSIEFINSIQKEENRFNQMVHMASLQIIQRDEKKFMGSKKPLIIVLRGMMNKNIGNMMKGSFFYIF